MKRPFFLFVVSLIISKALVSQNAKNRLQHPEACTINEIHVTENKGTINVGTQNIYICKPCNLFFDSTDVLSVFDLKEAGDAPKKEIVRFTIVEEKKRGAIAGQFLDSISKTFSGDCNVSFIQDAIAKKIPFDVYQNDDKSSIMVRYHYPEYELAKYGLKVKYLAKEGLTRIKELDRYYFLKEDGSPLVNIDGEAERYDLATDLHNGLAIVGKYSPKMNYRLMDKTGKKSDFSFTDWKEEFSGFKRIYRLKSREGKYFLANTDMKIMSGAYDSIWYFNDEDYTRYERSNYDSSYSVIGLRYFMTANDHHSGLLKIGFAGNVLDSLPARYYRLEFLGHNVISACMDGLTYLLLDGETHFRELGRYPDRIYFVRNNSSGFEFATSDPRSDSMYDFQRNTHGAFIDFGRVIIEPKYRWLGYYTKVGLMHAIIAPVDNGKWKETFLDIDGRQVFGNYGTLFNPDGRGYIRTETLKGKWGYLNANEKYVIKPNYEFLTAFGLFGLAWAEMKDGKCGLIDRDGDYSDLSEEVSRLRYWDGKTWTYYPHEFTDYGIAVTEFAIASSTQRKFGIVNFHRQILFKGHPVPLYIVGSGIRDVCLVTDSFRLYMYFKNGQPFGKPPGKIIRPYKNGYAVAECADGGVSLIDSSGQQYRDCMPYDSLSDVIHGKFVIATKEHLKGIIKISTGEKFVDIVLNKIELDGDSFVCTQAGKSFSIKANPEDKKIRFVAGDQQLFESVVLKRSK